MKNRYLEHAHIDERTFRHILRCFCLDIEANKVASITHISRQSINKLFSCFRFRIASACLMRNFISSLLSIKYGVVLYFIPNRLIILIKNTATWVLR